MAFKLSIPNAPRMSIPKAPNVMKAGAPHISLPKSAKAPKPFMPRNRRFNPAPNSKDF